MVPTADPRYPKENSRDLSDGGAHCVSTLVAPAREQPCRF